MGKGIIAAALGFFALSGCLADSGTEMAVGGLAEECVEDELTMCVAYEELPRFEESKDDTFSELEQGGCSMAQIRWATGQCAAMRARYGLPRRAGITGCWAHSWGLELGC